VKKHGMQNIKATQGLSIRSDEGLNSQETMLDLEELLLAFDNDTEFVKELLTIYLTQSSPKILSNIAQAIQGQNPQLLEKAAHRLKGASGIIGAKQISMIASILEQMGSHQTFTGAYETLQSLEQRLEALKKYVEGAIESSLS
jgi:HPt (histidine-containing phosphotransfer) domain-containing protein